MKRVRVSAPGKLMLFGEHAVVFGKPCLVTAVDRRMYVTAEILEEQEFQLDVPDVQVRGYKKLMRELGKGDIPKGAKFVEIAVRNFLEAYYPQEIPATPFNKGGEKYFFKEGDSIVSPSLVKRGQGRFIGGIKITTKSDFSPRLGFGSSAAVTVGTIKALSALFGAKLSSKEIFDLSYKTVLDVQGQGSGFDVAASVYGGTLYFVTGGKVIERLVVGRWSLVVGYSGQKADTVKLINKVKGKADLEADIVENIYNEIGEIVEKAKSAIISENWKEVGALMNKNQMYLRELGVSSEKLDIMIKASLNAGAYGAKLSGAGGGDCMIAIVAENKRSKVIEAIKKAGGEIIGVKTNAEGVRVEN